MHTNIDTKNSFYPKCHLFPVLWECISYMENLEVLKFYAAILLSDLHAGFLYGSSSMEPHVSFELLKVDEIK